MSKRAFKSGQADTDAGGEVQDRPGLASTPALPILQPYRTASTRNAHIQQTRHPIIEGYDPLEAWGWCYVDETFIDQTEQRGPIPRLH
ncbi:hypothetical protein U1839_10955 [Sphingomonas sp. RT2P30]|uniref:hypothetical protein n=1 Tax=Parasphingomonas halimpatiens TaxID=3096162 RepID=UPI002FCB50C6